MTAGLPAGLRREEKEIHVTGKQKEGVGERSGSGQRVVWGASRVDRSGEAGHGYMWKWHNETHLPLLT